jgi:hypothetical protein
MNIKKYKIYTLNDPITNEIRYVGQTIQKLENRLKKHLNAKDKSYRTNWIKNLNNKKLSPTINLVIEADNKEETNKLEMYYINLYKEKGYNLVNMTKGGEGSIGFKHKKSTKEKLRIIKKEYKTKQAYGFVWKYKE